MKKYILTALVLFIVIGAGWYWHMISNSRIGTVACTQEAKICPDGSSVGRSGPDCAFAPCPIASTVPDYKNATYSIEGQLVTLVNGRASASVAPGSAAQTVTEYFGNEAAGDLNGDGVPDVGFILTQSSGGSGTFFYAVAALKTAAGFHGTNAILLGDRIAPQALEIRNGQLVVNYADRAAGEPMSTSPSVGVSKYLQVSGTTLSEVQPAAGAGEHCGGNMRTAAVCIAGYHCAPTPGSHLPLGDVGGTCAADQ